MRNRRELSFIAMHSLIRISQILKAGVAKNPVSELMNGVQYIFLGESYFQGEILLYNHFLVGKSTI